MNPIICFIAISALTVSAQADSYQPQPASGGPYPAAIPPTPSAAPYPPSGWKPSGRQFLLPARQTSQTYLPPNTNYGPPSTTPAVDTESATESTTTKPEPESQNFSEFAAEQQIPDSGTYYVLLPDGRLQKVSYSTMPLVDTGRVERLRETEAEKKSNGYVANVKYQDVEPINGPIYAYNNAPLVRVYK